MIKDKKIKVEYLDPYEEVYTTIYEGWAYFRHMSGTETFNAGIANNGKRNVVFIFTPPKGVSLDTSARVTYQGVKFNVINIDDFEGYAGDIKVYASGNYY